MTGEQASLRQASGALDHEEIRFFRDPASGLRAIIALHDTSRGPALGGIRCRRYDNQDEAVADVLRLSYAMTQKTAIAGLSAGGGKCVVIEHPDFDRVSGYALLGQRIQEMGGRFFTSSDYGTTDDDLRRVRSATRYVTDPDDTATGGLAAKTAEGVFLAAGTCLDILGIAEWHGIRIAIQGLGKIGLPLATMAARAGAEVIATDISPERVELAADTLGLKLVAPDDIYAAECDVFAPCGVGGVLNSATIPRLRCRIIAGAANNQLADLSCAEALQARGILYAPDFVVNAGAVIVGCAPACLESSVPVALNSIATTVREICLESITRKVPTQQIALERADRRWQEARAGRSRN